MRRFRLRHHSQGGKGVRPDRTPRRPMRPPDPRQEFKGRGTAGKTGVAGVEDRAANRGSVKVVPSTDGRTLQSFTCDHAGEGTVTYTDEHGGYRWLAVDFEREAVNHSVGEYARGMGHTHGIESFRAMLKRAHKRTSRKVIPKHLQRYVAKFAGPHNVREADIVAILAEFMISSPGKRLRYRKPTADNGLFSGALS